MPKLHGSMSDHAKSSRQGSLAQERGRAFENAIISTARAYERARLLVLRKVDPPMFVTRIAGRVIARPKRSQFLDFVGAWTERGGRAVIIEAKSIKQAVLPLLTDRGLKQSQWDSLRVWHWSGAMVAVLWRHSGGVVWIAYDQLRAAIDAGSASFPARDGHAVAVDWARDRVEFLPVLRALADGKAAENVATLTETQD